MTWWLRFCLGLPARPEDVAEVRRSLPELFDRDFQFDDQFLLPWWPSPAVRGLTVADLRRWAHGGEEPTVPPIGSPEDCPAEQCPLRKGPRLTGAGDTFVGLRLMVAGGAHKPPKDEFLDLVRRVHKGQSIREVILTDRYIYLDVSERGSPGGYTALVEYLDALKLKRDSVFDLKLNPSPRKAAPTTRGRLERKVQSKFPHARVGTFAARHRFHDRFYLTRDASGRLTGVYGPSLNGLGEKSVVLMGELEPTALKRIQSLV